MNTHLIVGELVEPPVIRDAGQSQVANLRVRTESSLGDGRTFSAYHNVVVWGQLAQKCKGIRPGCTVAITGEVRAKKWVKDDGSEQWQTTTNASRIEFDQQDQQQQQGGQRRETNWKKPDSDPHNDPTGGLGDLSDLPF
jgi:single-stranded DNA-binding protein